MHILHNSFLNQVCNKDHAQLLNSIEDSQCADNTAKYSRMKAIIASILVLACSTTMAQTTGLIKAPATKQTTATKPVNNVKGTILDAATKKPAVGIRVEVPQFSAAITDANGQFTLKVPAYDVTIEISGEGYDTRYEALKGRKEISISLLDESIVSNNDIVVTPTGKQIKRNITASMGQYDVSGWNNPTDVSDALLQGRIAGLNVTRRSGGQGAGANMVLRGYNSLFGTNKPLIVIDNLLYDANDYGQSIIANNYTNPLALIDTKDIDNISVLRDASSIYGTKGANGAILITTSRAKVQATKIDFGSYLGVNQAPNNLPVMNSKDYRVYLNEMLQSKGMTSTDIAALPYMNDNANTNTQYPTYHNETDWQQKVLQNSLSHNYFLKVTGGDNIATYGLSMGYMKNEGIVTGTDLTRYNMRFNAEFNFSQRFKGFSNFAYTYNEQNLKDQGISNKTAPIYLSLVKAPFLTDHVVNSAGIVSPNLADADVLGISNPSAVIELMKNYNKYYRFAGSVGFSFEISPRLKANTIIGVVYDKVRENIFVPSIGVVKDTLNNAIANNRLGTQVKRLSSIFNDTYLEYNNKLSTNNKFTARAGVRYQNNKAEQDFALGFNSATDELVSVQNGLTALRQVGGGIGNWNWMNIYANADYAYKSKFFLSFNMAADASSRFGAAVQEGIAVNGVRMALMPSLSTAWLISSEKFMAKSGINLLKLRASYGLSGNDDIGNYTSRQTYGSQNLLGMQGLVRTGIANPQLQWETSKKINAGIDFAILNERLSISLDAYQNTTSNMLVYQDLNTTTGFSSVITNGGSMQNNGIELSVTARVINKNSFKWDLGFNISKNKSNIISVPNGQFTTNYAGATIITANGQDANLFYGYVAKGVFATDTEAGAANLSKKNANGTFSNFNAGDIRFADLNGDKIIDENDRQVIGNPNADFTGGITNKIIYKRFELNALFTFSKGNDVYNYMRYRLESMAGVENQLSAVNNRWHGLGQITDMPKATFGDPMGNSRFSNRWIEDGSYFRLRSISLQYYIPLKSGVLHNATIYATGTNLFTLTKYKGYDPEFSAATSIFAQGIDTGLDPQFKSVIFGVRFGL